ncbi:MAG: polysulfide reductase NrfD [Sulfurospirillaceae bacterium]|nr:polysulfide reductase NrfD [Sulfurospirillaceae bacterium]MDD3462329.1 polysulfide reductase NrfD [Sulfurospirillaceae bacterium]
MEHAAMELLSYVFPNDQHVHWNLMIVIYPYITGVVAGAFIVSALAHVFNVKELKPVAKFALIFALSWLLFVTAPLLNHLGHPERALNMLFTPNFVGPSMMSGFGYIYMAYSILLIFEILVIYRYELTTLKATTTGVKKAIYEVLTLWTNDLSLEGRKRDHKVAFVMAAVGIPLACSLHGYVGFIFGAVKTVEWWFTPLMPIIFLLSASVSGIAGMILFYIVIKKMTGRMQDISTDTIKVMVKLLWAFFIFDFLFEMIELAVHAYGGTEGWHHVKSALDGPLNWSFWIMQVQILSIIPFLALGYLSLVKVSRNVLLIAGPIVSFMLLAQVLFMRWNVVIGGQVMAKSERGFSVYHPEFLGKEGILVTIIMLVAPIVTLWILSKIFPLWESEADKELVH